jgi:hypothetical protein
MADRGEYKFHIDAFNPLTLPMARLKDYLIGLIDLFGNDDFVHFLRVEEGTAAPTCFVEPRVVGKVEHRLVLVKSGGADERAQNAFTFLNDRLFDDNAVADLTDHQGVVLHFPGREAVREPEIGPITETGVLEGEVFQIGGKDESIQIYLRDGERTHICTTSREKGREIAAEYLFKGRVRIHGEGQWKRLKDERWKLTKFDVSRVEPLGTDKLSDVVNRLRAIESPELKKIKDPLAYLDEIKRDAGD